MNALELIRQTELPPDQLEVVEGAFEKAWLQLAPTLGKDTSSEHARIRLVSVILWLICIIGDDQDRLTTVAIKVFNRHHE